MPSKNKIISAAISLIAINLLFCLRLSSAREASTSGIESPVAIASPIEQFFSSQANKPLEQFGYKLFHSAEKMDFIPPTKTPVSPNYLIGPGDEVFIHLWGLVENSFQVIVDRDGKIVLPKVGALHISGLSLGELKEFLFQQFSRFFTKFKLNVSLGQLRSVQVIVSGEVHNPGTYLLSPLSTIYHALFQCGGPTKEGSLRRIKRIKRNNAADYIDLYQFLLHGDRNQDKSLEDGDIIFVPPIGSTIAIIGPVKRPGIYEKNKTLTIEQLITMAGGTFLGGNWSNTKIERIRSAEEKPSASVSIPPDSSLHDGDLIRLDLDMVTLNGEVKHPGKYIIREGERLSSVLKRAGGFTKFTYLKGAFFTRESAQSLQKDRLNTYISFLEKELLLLSSRAKREALSPQDNQRIEKSMAIENQLLDKMKNAKPTGRVIVNISPLKKFEGSVTDIELEGGDTLYIPRRPGTVNVLGEVYNPTSIVYVPDKSARYYIQKVGGITGNAEKDNIYIIKADGSIVGRNEMSRFHLSWDAEEKWFVSRKISGYPLEAGDAIIIPPRLKSLALKKNMMDWSQIFYQTALGAGVLINAYDN